MIVEYQRVPVLHSRIEQVCLGVPVDWQHRQLVHQLQKVIGGDANQHGTFFDLGIESYTYIDTTGEIDNNTNGLESSFPDLETDRHRVEVDLTYAHILRWVYDAVYRAESDYPACV